MTIIEPIKSREDFWRIFHQEWGKAHDCVNYDKKTWLEMANFINKIIEEAENFEVMELKERMDKAGVIS